jgi:predicted nucleotidyltransferase
MVLHGIDIERDRLADICRRYRLERMWLFGSVLRDDFRSDSDIDILVETRAGAPVGLFALGGLQMDLSDLFGREVHVTTLGSVPAQVRPELLRSASLQYAA